MKSDLDTCGCCEGIRAKTPQPLENPPGQDTLAYRVGTHASFKESMLGRLSRDLPALTTREDDDPSIALCDALATVLDVLTFYQERIINESYLHTATERNSILELARNLGYELSPGVAASTVVAFELESAPGSPTEVRIQKGAKIQSIPGPGEQAQVFETTEDIVARPEWNGLQPRLSQSNTLAQGSTKAYIEGLSNRISVGDSLLFVRSDNSAESHRVRQVDLVPVDGTTCVTWGEELHADAQELHVFRQRAALFGHNAPDWKALSKETKESYLLEQDFDPALHDDWPDEATADSDPLTLDSRYPDVTRGSWVVVEGFGDGGPLVAKVSEVRDVVAAGYTLSSCVTQVNVPTVVRPASLCKVRQISLLVKSEKLKIAEVPLGEPLKVPIGKDDTLSIEVEPPTLTPLSGNRIPLHAFVPGLVEGHHLIVQGRPSRVLVSSKEELLFHFNEGASSRTLSSGDTLTVIKAPVPLEGRRVLWRLADLNGVEGHVRAAKDSLELLAADEKAGELAEVVTLGEDLKAGEDLKLATSLTHLYDRKTVTIHGNVAPATHGERKAEVLGSGDSSKANTSLYLKHKPLTFVADSTAKGSTSTLEVRVNDILWEHAPSLYRQGPRQEVYVTRIADDGNVQVIFGDGVMGARVPTGVENVKASYRVGTGRAGMLKAGQLSLLLSRPLGLKSVVGPVAPSGAEDPESRDAARQNAPFTVRTLDRIVSLQDYEDFARVFAGIGKAQATWLWDGNGRVVHLTVAGADGKDVAPGSKLDSDLNLAIAAASPPGQEVVIGSYVPLRFKLEANLGVDRRYRPEKVKAAVHDALLWAFSFNRREFAQAVPACEVLAVIQGVEGVRFVDLDKLYVATPSTECPPPPLIARRARWNGTIRTYEPAELLTVHPMGIDLGWETA